MELSKSPSAADIPDEFKTTLARLYKALHENGVARSLFVACLKTAGQSVSPSQLDRWVARLGTLNSVIKEEKESGAIPHLDREQRNVSSGWVLHENETGSIVSIASFYDFILKYFQIKLSNPSISRYLNEDGFTCRLIHKKGKSFVVNIEALCKKLWDWVIIQDFRARRIHRDRLASIDFTFTGHRTERRTTFAPRGGPQPMAADTSSNFTNCIVTCAWADGINRTPPILFTYNSAFRRDRNPTPRRASIVNHLLECMDKYGISAERIIYIGEDTKEMKKYARECPDLIRRFFGVYEVPPGCTIYSDEGNSFFDNGESVLVEVGFEKHCCYPSDVHQYLSVNDNKLHGTSKQSNRSSGVNYSDDVETCLSLLHFLDRDIINQSKKWWDRNMIELTEEGVMDLIGKGPWKQSHLHKSWKRSYEEFMNEYDENNKS